MKMRFFCFIGLLSFLFNGCSERPVSEKIVVVATTTMVADLVKEIGGEKIELISLMGPTVDPHLYKPSTTDIITLDRAQGIFYSGLMLEGRMADTFAKKGNRGVKVYAVTSTIPEEQLLEPEEFEGHWDPHVWGDVTLWAQCIDAVVKGLTELDPASREYFLQRAEDYRSELLQLHTWVKQKIALLPQAQRVLITSHDAFNYFGRAYGLEVLALQGISTVTEAGAADRVSLVNYIKKNGIKALFVESSVNPAAIEAISADAGVEIGGELFSDAMGEAGKIETVDGESYDVGTYVGMIKHNVNEIVNALK